MNAEIRGHHGAGKHVRARRPRLSYGPRNSARRAEWLKTDAGKAWAERQAVRAGSRAEQPKPKPKPEQKPEPNGEAKKPLGGVTFSGQFTGVWNDSASQRIAARAIQTHGNSAFGLKAGESLTPEYFGRLVGAPDGARVTATLQEGSAFRAVVKVEHPAISSCERELLFNLDGAPSYVKNQYFFLKPNAPEGFGTTVFLQQVTELSRRGFSTIQTDGIGTGSGVRSIDELNAANLAQGKPKVNQKPMLGFYIWPRLGYDAKLTFFERERIGKVAPQFAEAKTVRELMKLPGGAQWWKYNGSERRYTFDLTPNSESMKIAAAYVQERKVATGTKSYFTSRAKAVEARALDWLDVAIFRAAERAMRVGDYVRWNSSGGPAQGRIERIQRAGTLTPPNSSFRLIATASDPAALIRVFRPAADGGWRATETLVAHRLSALRLIPNLTPA